MKRLLSITLFAFILAIPVFSQNNKGNKPTKEEMREFKMQFIAEEMELKEDQKPRFMELYSQMENERRAAFTKMKEAEKKIKDNKNASEADYEKATREINQARQQMAVIESNYDKKFEVFLTKKQIYKMKEAENNYMKRMRKSRDKKSSHKEGGK